MRTWSVKREQVRDESWGSGVPRNVGRDGASFEDGDHVPQPLRVFWVLFEDVQEARVHSSVEHSNSCVVLQHPLVPEHINSTTRAQACHQPLACFPRASPPSVPTLSSNPSFVKRHPLPLILYNPTQYTVGGIGSILLMFLELDGLLNKWTVQTDYGVAVERMLS